MRGFWSDREGNPAPSKAQFHFFPFSASVSSSQVVNPVALPKAETARVVKRTFLPNREQWIEGVEEALAHIQRKELEKVVLARICVLELEQAPDPFALTAALQEVAEGAFLFCFASGKEAFLGASPERLYVRQKSNITSEAVAGTGPRGGSEKELLSCPKILREFSPVQTHLETTLTPLCRDPVQSTPLSIHRTKHVQHLYSRCTGKLKEGIRDEEVVRALHPTPALCGLPKEKALSVIQKREPFSRGLYGGAIGWTTEEASEWIVAIRCCHLQGKQATLFSGAGIVEGSDPEEEWEELNQKLRLYERILDH